MRAEYSEVYSESSKLLVGIWDEREATYFPSRTEKDFQRYLIWYLKSAKIFVNAGLKLSKEISTSNPTRYALPPFELVEEDLRETVGRLVAALKMMPRLETLEITYVNLVKDKREFSDYDPKAGLEPFADLMGLQDVSIKGDLSDDYAAHLRSSMMRPKIPSIQRNETRTSPLRSFSPASSSSGSWSSSSSRSL